MGEKELRIKLSELDRLSVVCGRCRAAVTFPSQLTEGIPDKAAQHGHCPSCGWTLHHVGDIVSGFRSIHRMANETEGVEIELVIRLGAGL